MADTTRILHHIAELYAKPKANQEFSDAVYEMEEKLNAHFDDYDKAFDGKLTANILKAVDDYWRFKNDKTRPTLALLMAMENSDVAKKESLEDTESEAGMRKRCINCMRNLYDKYGLSGAQHYWDAMLAKFEIPYPATDEIMQGLK